jgi:hypothetical protein
VEGRPPCRKNGPRFARESTAATTEPLGGGEEAHRRWPEGRSERGASKAKHRPPGSMCVWRHRMSGGTTSVRLERSIRIPGMSSQRVTPMPGAGIAWGKRAAYRDAASGEVRAGKQMHSMKKRDSNAHLLAKLLSGLSGVCIFTKLRKFSLQNSTRRSFL